MKRLGGSDSAIGNPLLYAPELDGNKAGKFPVKIATTLFFLRPSLYLLVTIAVFETIVLAAVGSPTPAALFKENGLWEWTEFSLFAASSGLLFVNARRNDRYTHILTLCGLLALFAAMRELDQFLATLAFAGAYKVVNGLILAVFVYVAGTQRRYLSKTLATFAQTAPFYFFMSGVLVVIYGELIGQAEFWAAIMGDDYVRPVKRAAEELAELMGYLLIFFGAVETCFLKVGDPAVFSRSASL